MKQSFLDSNLDAIARRCPRFADRVRHAQPAGDLALHPGKADPELTGRYRGASLASAYRPAQEARQFAESVNLIENAVVIVLGFGLGWHVRELCRRMRRTGVIVVFEPDLSLMRSVLEAVDHSRWLADAQIAFFDDENDRAEIALRLDGAQALVVQGTTIVEHSPSRGRLHGKSAAFRKNFTEFVAATRTTMLTTLVHSATTCRNSLLNLDRYAGGAGIGELQNLASGHPGILIAAGPSLARNLALLDDPRVRDKVIIIAVQTMLKPLLERGIRPHFVTALDYHEISGQFYDGLTEDDVAGVTLIVEPKANRAIVEGFPGSIRCVGSAFLDQVLGSTAASRAPLRPGATVAHLSFYFAQFLGCDPIVLIGQDLAFTDGLYYGSGAAIHQQWGPEVNRFTSLEAMEWQRIARMKRTLRQADGYGGRSVLIDEQMQTYLQQFERDFSSTVATVIDATEGGCLKRNCEVRALSSVLGEHVYHSPLTLPEIPTAPIHLDQTRVRVVLQRVRELRQRTRKLIDISRQTSHLIDLMLTDQHDAKRMQGHFRRMDGYRAEVETLMDVMALTNSVSQLGVFKRLKADRRIDLSDGLEPVERQRLQLARDKVNVDWLVEAGEELCACLDESECILQGGTVNPRTSQRFADGAKETFQASADQPLGRGVSLMTAPDTDGQNADCVVMNGPTRVAAIIAVDPERSDLGIARRLDERFYGESVLACVVRRLARCAGLDDIILLAPEGCDRALIEHASRSSQGIHVTIEPMSMEEARSERQRAVAAARRWSDTSWRGGIGGASVYDEIMRPKAMLRAMERHQLAGALVVGSDWALVDPGGKTGCGAIIEQFRERPDARPIVFSQCPPGLCGCVVSRSFLQQMAAGTRGSMIGAVLSYMPHLPQLDPISTDLCVKVPMRIRSSQARFTFDTQHRRDVLRGVFEGRGEEVHQYDAQAVVSHYDEWADSELERFGDCLPMCIEMELTTDRGIEWYLNGVQSVHDGCEREPMSLDRVARIIEQAAERDDVAITLGGAGDPLLHPQFPEIVRLIHDAGVSAIHVVTDLVDGFTDADQLLDLPIDVLSVRLNADREEQYRRLTKSDRFQGVVSSLESLINLRGNRSGDMGQLALPWIVPSIWRCAATLEDMKNLYDRWMYFVNAASIEPPPWLSLLARIRADRAAVQAGEVLQLNWPRAVVAREARRWMCIRSDGQVEVDAFDWRSPGTAGSVMDRQLGELWPEILSERSRRLNRDSALIIQQADVCGAVGA